jgi:bifunctional UDP-N-acetylglucosamine pyrophosphorylase/glucosamine-1-phosphate N-acetyltransferase
VLTDLAARDQTVADVAVVVLAAGQGTRLKSRLPKPLHQAAGRPLIDHVLRAASALRPARVVVVTGHGAAAVRQHLGLGTVDRPREALQSEQRGTAHAVMAALPHLDAPLDSVVVVYADTPLVTGATLRALVAARHASGARLAMVTCLAPDPTGYGRIVRDATGQVVGIVEEKVASPAERAINEINAGFYALAADWLRATLPRVEPSPTGE